jgi:hypothetical protein
MPDQFTRDEMGRFAAAAAENGGGQANFGGNDFEGYPSTRDALLKNATSKPSSPPANNFKLPEFAPAYDPEAGDRFLASMNGGEGAPASESFGGGQEHEPEQDAYIPSGHAPADWNPNMADRLSPHAPPAPEPAAPQEESQQFSGSQTGADSGLGGWGPGAPGGI